MGKNKPANQINKVDEVTPEVVEESTPPVPELTDEQKSAAILAPHRARLLARRNYAANDEELHKVPTWTPRHLKK